MSLQFSHFLEDKEIVFKTRKLKKTNPKFIREYNLTELF